MKVIKYLFILIIVALAGITGYFALQDGAYQVTETKVINAPRELLYEQVADFNNWKNWNNFVNRKDLDVTMGQVSQGIGGHLKFNNADLAGKMTITSEQPLKRVTITTSYTAGTRTNDEKISIDLAPAANGYKIIWTVKGECSLKEKITNFVTQKNIEKETRLKFQKSLKNLNAHALKSMSQYTIEPLGIKTTVESYYLGIETVSSIEKFPNALAAQKERLLRYINDNHLVMVGKPVVFYEKIDRDYNAITFRIAVPVPICPNQDPNNPEITCSYKPASDDVVVLLTGNYRHLNEAMEQAERFVIDKNLEKSGLVPYEVYLIDGSTVQNPAMFKTEVHIPIKRVVVYE